MAAEVGSGYRATRQIKSAVSVPARYETNVTCTELFNTLMISSGTITHRIDRLEQVDLVQRIPDPSDRRGTLVRLTDRGFNAIEKAVEAHVANGHGLIAVLEEEERKLLTRLLRKLLISFEE